MIKDKPKEELTKAQKANERNRRIQITENSVMDNWKKSFSSKQVRRGKEFCKQLLINARKNPDANTALKRLIKFLGLTGDTSGNFTKKAGYAW